MSEQILLCSDGLTDMLNDRRIAQVLSRIADPSLAVQTIFELALRAGGRDNVSIIFAGAAPTP
jgi:serine/threonine protein phosphatase PrpC